MKKKITAIALVAILAVIGIVGFTMAYFTDTHEVTNSFTFGNGVDVTLDEGVVEFNKAKQEFTFTDRYNERTETGIDYSKLIKGETISIVPGMSIPKDPTLLVKAGNDKSYMAMTISMSKETFEMFKAACKDVTEGDGPADVAAKFLSDKKLFTGFKANLWNISVFTLDAEGKQTLKAKNVASYVIRLGYTDFLGAINKDKTIVLFDGFMIPESLDSETAAKFTDRSFNLTIASFTVQALGFAEDYNKFLRTDRDKALNTVFEKENLPR